MERGTPGIREKVHRASPELSTGSCHSIDKSSLVFEAHYRSPFLYWDELAAAGVHSEYEPLGGALSDGALSGEAMPV